MTAAEFIAAESAHFRERLGRPLSLHVFRWFAAVVCAADVLLIASTSAVSGYAYHRLVLGSIGDAEVFVGVGVFFSVYYSIVMAARGNFGSAAVSNYLGQVREISFAWFSGLFILMIAMFTLKTSGQLSRGATGVFLVSGLFGLLIWRRFVALGLRSAIARGEFVQRNIVVVGEAEQMAGAEVIDDLRRAGARPVKIFSGEANYLKLDGPSSGMRDLVRNIVEVSRCSKIDEIILALDWHHSQRIEELVHELRVLPIPVRLLPDQNALRFLGLGNTRTRMAWSVEVQRAPLSEVEQAAKRMVDLALASIATLLFLPLLILVSLLIKLDSRGPILFTQSRDGFGGRSFRIFKFRSMTVTEDGPIIRQATRNDPRVTRIGRWLRKTSIDELPQLFNVLLGDMSLVGPRPHAFAHGSEFERRIASYAFRHHVKPGITGWAQVNGLRGETATIDLMERRVEFDLWYINNWNLWFDLKILFRTVFVLCRQPLAY